MKYVYTTDAGSFGLDQRLRQALSENAVGTQTHGWKQCVATGVHSPVNSAAALRFQVCEQI